MNDSKRIEEKLRGTVNLLKQALALIFYLVIAGLIMSFTISFAYGMILIGVGVFAIGGIILSYRRIIWDSYVLKFNENKATGLMKKLLAPSMISYKLNVYIICPLAIIVGIVLMLIGVFSSLD